MVFKANKESERHEIERSKKRRMVCSVKRIAEYLGRMCVDLYLMYYIGYMVFACLGFWVHHFFYVFHLTDIIYRNPYLKNVLKALYRPRYELLFTCILFLVIEFIFTIIAYTFFFNDFYGSECTYLN